MKDNAQLEGIKGRRFTTSSFKELVVLTTNGIDLFGRNAEGKLNPSLCLSNVYSKAIPYNGGKRPGHVTYFLCSKSPGQDGVEASGIADAFRKGTADSKWDEVFKALEEEIRKSGSTEANKLLTELKKLTPFMLAAYSATLLLNREKLLDLWKRARPYIMIRKGLGTILVSTNASEELKDKLLK